MHTSAVLAAALLLSSSVVGASNLLRYISSTLIVTAHPGGHAYPDSGLLAKRSEKTARCANAVGAMKQKRHQSRKREQAAEALAKRGNETTFAIHADAPRYDFIKNDSCILYPETTQGPYWYPPSQLLTRDMAQDEVGVPLELDIGVIDMATCEPLENALISLWVSMFNSSTYCGTSANRNNSTATPADHTPHILDVIRTRLSRLSSHRSASMILPTTATFEYVLHLDPII